MLHTVGHEESAFAPLVPVLARLRVGGADLKRMIHSRSETLQSLDGWDDGVPPFAVPEVAPHFPTPAYDSACASRPHRRISHCFPAYVSAENDARGRPSSLSRLIRARENPFLPAPPITCRRVFTLCLQPGSTPHSPRVNTSSSRGQPPRRRFSNDAPVETRFHI